jgi:hypothetical protein
MRCSVVMVVSDEADPFHLSAASPSTGSNSVSGEGAIAPTAAVRGMAAEAQGSTHGGRSSPRSGLSPLSGDCRQAKHFERFRLGAMDAGAV